MHPHLVKEKLLTLLEQRALNKPYLSLENYALYVLKSKLSNDALSAEECHLLIDEVLANCLEFNQEGEPVGDTLLIEELIDFLIKITHLSEQK